MHDRDRPPMARMTWSAEGAPFEPQRTRVRVGWSDAVHAIPVRLAEDSFLGQEALEPRYVQIAARDAVPALVARGLDVAIVDLATVLGERVLGWDGVAIAMFGPVADDRSIGVAVVERDTWHGRRDACERLWRASMRALERARAELAAGRPIHAAGVEEARLKAAAIESWWPTCRPSSTEIGTVALWDEGPPTIAIDAMLAWE